jgi:gamma-glutamyl-gamma-aminobutyrate hydrolase PuuD
MNKKIFVTAKIEIDQHNQTYVKIPNDILNYLHFLKFKVNFGYHIKNNRINSFVKYSDGLILSGNGDINKINKNKENLLRDNFEKKIIDKFLKKNKPILCICRGFQLYASMNGTTFIKSQHHVKKIHNLAIKKNSKFIKDKKLKVNSFHNYIITSLNEKKLKIISKTSDGSIEIAEHKNKRLLCIMFHPERKNSSQKKIDIILKNFFK